MIIKKRKPAQSIPALDFPAGQSYAASAEEASDPGWTSENLEAGLIEDRRRPEQPELPNVRDRRGNFRRVEDKLLISKAHEEANAIREDAYEKGFQEGLERSEQVIAELRETIDQLAHAREEALLNAAEDIGALAVEIAERILKTEVSCDPSLINALVKDTIQKAGRNTKSILVKVHPDDLQTVKQFFKEDPVPELRSELIVMEDRMVDVGSCIVETDSGLVDASFATQLEILRQLFGSVPKRAAHDQAYLTDLNEVMPEQEKR